MMFMMIPTEMKAADQRDKATRTNATRTMPIGKRVLAVTMRQIGAEYKQL